MKCDAEGFAALYSTVYTDMYRFALCMMKSSHDAEDAVSEAVIQAYEHIGSLRSEESFKSWIFTILANTCRKKWRQQERDQKKAELSFFSGEDESAPDWDQAVDVRNAFAILAEEEQLIVGLSVFGGYTSGEIGELLEKSPSTVRSKMSRALAKMSLILKE
ncbi:RNA polymerase sigma factor [Faecalicatena contorta]|uniref:RNA polymerase sigma factor n=1 Tax=Faecalicatena fissicatena TaxID=290055 RepID=A0ABS2E9Z7_9FIRM|nr:MULTISPECIES: RNA polymerase sigma factor [Clostridia]MBM6685139.1 RNA polymerase sigma factor [Faecalicatena contorta]MBM6710986.1 RNA polymerase sigma factor [Faecalicatena contorta]MBM6738435.1 RNA polymerase sigma factor [Faecalicatena fissicatena]HIX99718.1 RNA polymerase sigma factor [Candidatus Dorea intestinigallinarum]